MIRWLKKIFSCKVENCVCKCKNSNVPCKKWKWNSENEIFKAVNASDIKPCDVVVCDNFICSDCNKHIFENLPHWWLCNPKLEFCECDKLKPKEPKWITIKWSNSFVGDNGVSLTVIPIDKCECKEPEPICKCIIDPIKVGHRMFSQPLDNSILDESNCELHRKKPKELKLAYWDLIEKYLQPEIKKQIFKVWDESSKNDLDENVTYLRLDKNNWEQIVINAVDKYGQKISSCKILGILPDGKLYLGKRVNPHIGLQLDDYGRIKIDE